MGFFEKIWLIAMNDLKIALKDRSTILWLFIMPPVFFFFIGTVTQGGINFASTSVNLVVEDNDGGFLAAHFEDRLEENLFSVIHPEDVPVPEEGEEPQEFRKVVIPPNFTAQLRAGQQVSVSYIGLSSGFANDYDLVRVQKAALSVLGNVIVIKAAGKEVPITPETLAAATAGPRPTELIVKPAGRQMQIPSGFQQSVPGTLVMFTLLVLLTTGAAMLVDDRDKQLLRRLASAPYTRGQIVFGKWAGRMALATVQIGVAIGFSFLPFFEMNWGGALPMILVILLAWGAMCTSLALLLGSIAKTPAQAGGLGVFVTMALASLGGAWWPIEIAPDWMQTVQMFTPTGWTMDALHKLISFDAAWQTALPNLAILLVGAFFIGVLAAKKFRFV